MSVTEGPFPLSAQFPFPFLFPVSHSLSIRPSLFRFHLFPFPQKRLILRLSLSPLSTLVAKATSQCSGLRSRPKKEGACERETRVTLSRALVLSCAHYFHAPAAQATSQKLLGFASTHFFLQPSRAKLLQNASQLKTFSSPLNDGFCVRKVPTKIFS